MATPPQLSVMLSDGLGSSSAASFRGTSTARANAALSLTQTEDQEGRATEDKARPDEPTDDTIDPQVREIMELMLSEPRDNSPVEGTADTPQQTGQPNDPTEFTGDSQSLPKWIFDPVEGRWIELIEGREAVPYVPELPDGDNDVKPAVDWEAIAALGRRNRVIRVVAESLRRGDPKYNIVIRAGDVVRLYSGDIGFYYMTGHIVRPGVYAFRSGSSVTLKNAVAAAGGLDALGWPTRVTVYRRIGDREQMIQVDLDRIYAGVDPDFYLKRDDIVNFGTHPFAPFLFQIRNFTIPQLSGTLSYGVAYRFTRQETFFKNENLNEPSRPALFP